MGVCLSLSSELVEKDENPKRGAELWCGGVAVQCGGDSELLYGGDIHPQSGMIFCPNL